MKKDEYSIRRGQELSGMQWLPDNIAQYFSRHYCTIVISVCNTDVENGYGTRISKCLKIALPYCKCTRCGYHSLWNPDDRGKCQRHTYVRGWDDVFAYTLDAGETKMSLEAAFDEFLQKQSDDGWKPVVPLYI